MKGPDGLGFFIELLGVFQFKPCYLKTIMFAHHIYFVCSLGVLEHLPEYDQNTRVWHPVTLECRMYGRKHTIP